MIDGKGIVEKFNEQPFGEMEGYKTLDEYIDEALDEAREGAFHEAEKMGEVNLFNRNRLNT